MMRLRVLSALTLVAAITLTAPAAAQQREPESGSVAMGADAGFMVAGEEFHVGFTPAVFAEFYFTSRISGRVLGGWSRNAFVDQDSRSLEQVRAAFNVVYNWEYELWHPFVTGGVSVHRVRTRIDDVDPAGWLSRPGIDAGLGVEYFARSKISVTLEGTYYWVSRGDLPVASSGFVVSAGLKKYF
jgi:hypothetical protein